MAFNRLHDNCVGAVVLADNPGPAGNFLFTANRVRHNTKACAAGEDVPFAVSGVGIGLLGANDVRITHNVITGNVPSGDTAYHGGVVEVTGPGGTAPSGNHVYRNLIRHNDPDLFWDGSGTGNTFARNHCQTSTPDGLCH